MKTTKNTEIRNMFNGEINVVTINGIYTPVKSSFDYTDNIYGGRLVQPESGEDEYFENALVIGEYEGFDQWDNTVCIGANLLKRVKGDSSEYGYVYEIAITDPYADVYISLNTFEGQ